LRIVAFSIEKKAMGGFEGFAVDLPGYRMGEVLKGFEVDKWTGGLKSKMITVAYGCNVPRDKNQ